MWSLLYTAFLTSSGISNFFQFTNKSESSQPIFNLDFANEINPNLILPNSTIPDSYDLQVKVFLPGYVTIPPDKNNKFEGRVKIRLNITQETNLITLNAVGLKINASRLAIVQNNKLAGNVSIINSWEQNESEWIHFLTQRRLFPGEYFELQIDYSGNITDELAGLYFSRYQGANGTNKAAAVTNFMPIYARLLVPCYDQPDLKASWKVKISHPKGTTAWSNQKLEAAAAKDPEDANFLLSSFIETPEMSTYLLSLIVSDFAANTKIDTITYSIVTRKEASNMTQFALDTAIKQTKFFQQYFGIKYPLTKLDMVGIPDSSYGGMEDWGLIIYKEESLLYTPKLYSTQDRIVLTGLVAHELAHQWFGNLVTMRWWNDAWLNEGFAVLMGNIGSDAITNGTYRSLDYFLTTSFREALEIDCLQSSHPLSHPLETKADILAVYDTVAYQKGSSVMAMIRYLMGPDAFIQGIKSYLSKYSYQSTEPMNLIRELDSFVQQNLTGPYGGKLNLTAFISQWVYQKGYPVVTLEHINSTVIRITQQRFLIESDPEQSPFGFYIWDVPLWIQRGKSKPEFYWLRRDQPLFITDYNPQVTVLNAEVTAFMRQNYGMKDWQLLANQFQNDHLMFSERTRYAIIADAFVMASVEKLDYDTLFRMLTYQKQETSWLPLVSFETEFEKLMQYFDPNSDVYRDAINYHLSLLRPKYSSYLATTIAQTYLNDSRIYDSLRDTLIYSAYCSISDSCTEMRTIFQQQFTISCNVSTNASSSSCSTVVPPIRKAIYCNEVKTNDSVFITIFTFYQRETVAKEKNILLSALSCSQNINNLNWLLNAASNRQSQLIRLQDVGNVFGDVAFNKIGSSLVLNYLLNNWNQLYFQFNAQPIILTGIIESCLSPIKTQNDIYRVQNFMRSTYTTNEFKSFGSSLEAAQERVNWIQKNSDMMRNLFRKNTQ